MYLSATPYPSYLAHTAGMILGLRPANERRRYFVKTSLIGWGKPRISPALFFLSCALMD